MTAGWGYPFEITGGSGRVRISGERENIRESVVIILTTEPGERIFHPDFGTRLRQFLFEAPDSQTEEMIRREIRHALGLWEKRIYDVEVETDRMTGEQGVLRVEVSYCIAGSGERERVEIALGG